MLRGQTIQVYLLRSSLKEEIELLFWITGISPMKTETQEQDIAICFRKTIFYHYVLAAGCSEV